MSPFPLTIVTSQKKKKKKTYRKSRCDWIKKV